MLLVWVVLLLEGVWEIAAFVLELVLEPLPEDQAFLDRAQVDSPFLTALHMVAPDPAIAY